MLVIIKSTPSYPQRTALDRITIHVPIANVMIDYGKYLPNNSKLGTKGRQTTGWKARSTSYKLAERMLLLRREFRHNLKQLQNRSKESRSRTSSTNNWMQEM
jgi:hypothetical protein